MKLKPEHALAHIIIQVLVFGLTLGFFGPWTMDFWSVH